MNAADIAQALSERAEDVAAYLLPNGKRAGREWKAGSISGEPGQSLSVAIHGQKRGLWRDFATDQGGDLLDLWMAVRACSVAQAMREAAQWLGLRETIPAGAPKREYRRPPKPACTAAAAEVLSWLALRGIHEQTARDFRIAQRQEAGKTYAIFPYLRDGEFINAKFRNIAEKRDMRQMKEAEPCLFGWHLIDPKCRRIVITEGELDAMTLHQAGIAALSVNAGAGSFAWLESDWERLERFSDIVIAFDADEAGRKGARELARRLGEARARLCEFAPYKDANEALQAGESPEFFARAISEAKPIEPDGIRPFDAFLERVQAMFWPAPGEEAAGYPLAIGHKTQDWLVFRPGEVSVWTGINGHGKSQFLAQLSVQHAALGARWCVYSGEMPPAVQLKRLIKIATGQDRPHPEHIAQAARWIGQSMWVIDRVGSVELSWLIKVFEYANRRYGCDCFLIDSLMMLSDVPEDGSGAFSAQKRAIQTIADFAKRSGSHVHVVAHPRKGRDETMAPGKLDVGGSSRITDGADNVLSVWNAKHDPTKPDYNPALPDGHIALHKQRHGDVQDRKALLWSIAGCRQFSADSLRAPRVFVPEPARAPQPAQEDWL